MQEVSSRYRRPREAKNKTNKERNLHAEEREMIEDEVREAMQRVENWYWKWVLGTLFLVAMAIFVIACAVMMVMLVQRGIL